MSDKSKIEWTDATWNPVTGCSKISTGCINCYAETFSERFRGVPAHPFEQGFDLKLWPERLELPLKWKEPRRIFVNSMSDLFHKDIPDTYVMQIIEVMRRAKQHIFQVLTKRSERMIELTNQEKRNWPNNIWLGVSVENHCCVNRIHHLQLTPAKVKFISFEPLIGRVLLHSKMLEKINWVIVGGESGHRARPMKWEWVEDIHRKCLAKNIPFFFKQWGTFDVLGMRVGKKSAGRTLNGRIWNEMPVLV